LVGVRSKVLVLAGPSPAHASTVDALRERCEVVETGSIDQAIELLRHDQFDAIFSDSADFLPLERALVSQQANLILNTIGEGVCIVDGEARCNWMNRKMQAWPPRVHEKIRRTCQEAFDLFSKQVSPQTPDTPTFSRSKRYSLNIEDQQFLEMIASPVISPSGQVVQVVAVVWDATSTRRLQQKIDAIDKAGRELVRLESDALAKMNVAERLKLLEDKIISFTRELMHFDHFAIRLLDRRTGRLELVISVGLPPEALAIELHAAPENNGISGFVAATGRSYICPDVERDPRYVTGLDSAKSSLTVPLYLHDKVIGIFNIESRQRAAFNEDDRQFAEIFGRYVAIALNILDLMVVERVSTSTKITDDVASTIAGPLNDIASDANALMEDYIGNDDLRNKLQAIVDNIGLIREGLAQCKQGPRTILGAADVKAEHDPLLDESSILVADDELNIRQTIHDILRKYNVNVTICANGAEALEQIESREFDLIVSDIKMPDKTGYDIFAAAQRKSSRTPVILMTGFGYDPNHSIVRASQEGLQAVLFKPFKVNQLLGEVRKALQPAQVVRS
jgi:CheY-like chemotaxis protein